MASSKAYLEYVLEQLSGLEDVSCRPMMGEYVVYCRGRVIGGVYDDRFLVKPTASALAVLKEEGREPQTDIPYDGAKPMLVVDIDDRELTCRIVQAVADDTPIKKKPR